MGIIKFEKGVRENAVAHAANKGLTKSIISLIALFKSKFSFLKLLTEAVFAVRDRRPKRIEIN
jgi:hypothetical protein